MRARRACVIHESDRRQKRCIWGEQSGAQTKNRANERCDSRNIYKVESGWRVKVTGGLTCCYRVVNNDLCL